MVYVYPRGKKWIIYARDKHYGTFTSKEEAEEYRDLLITEGVLHPYSKNPNRYITKTEYGAYIITKRINGKKESFGVFRDIETAREERDRMEQMEWSYDE